jgi:peroxiredoxin family protein
MRNAGKAAAGFSVDTFGLTMEDFVPQVEDIISVGEFYEKATGGQIIFT